MQIIIFLISCYGISFNVLYTSIFNKPRVWIMKRSLFFNGLLSCILCCSTWVGFITSIMLGSLSANYFKSHILINIFYDGMIAAAGCYIIDSIIDRIKEN